MSDVTSLFGGPPNISCTTPVLLNDSGSGKDQRVRVRVRREDSEWVSSLTKWSPVTLTLCLKCIPVRVAQLLESEVSIYDFCWKYYVT